ncbi:hypothetical protein GvMRE_I1g546 [endosymbiont GvMRE of Glomus versiforme]|nr:hypothetical protein GvMRE_I1g546 [endosymbiont GvMRE of Glomus versiforme]
MKIKTITHTGRACVRECKDREENENEKKH